MTTTRKLEHLAAVLLSVALPVLLSMQTDSAWAHAAWLVPAIAVVRAGLESLKDAAALLVVAALGTYGCAHLPPGVNVPMCALDVIDDIGSVLVCNLADHVPLPACVIDGLRKVGTDHNCDVTGIVQAVAGNADRNAVATGDYLEAVKAQRARAWLAVQPPNPADVPPLHDRKK
jgi:hypothetical protein